MLTPGFSAAADAQKTFRVILQALSRPGVVMELPVALEAPAGLSVASAAVLLTLTDQATAVALPDGAGLRAWLAFHTGAPVVAVEDADFAVARTAPDLARLRIGSDAEPETGATLVLDCEGLDDGPLFRLTGPGIETEILRRLPLAADFAAARQRIFPLNPRGVDVLLCAGHRILGLPRSTKLEAV
jgi:alpha-D-ribose 1-methylphosphonate 5-triphosphate synthase subunit PhnH